MTGTPATPKATLLKAHRIGRAAGLRYVYTGNIHDAATQGTPCHGCGALLIGRDWYDITAWGLTDDGRCRHYGTPCAGVFDVPPGTWGAQPPPVRVLSGLVIAAARDSARSDVRPDGRECVITCSSRLSPIYTKKISS